LKKHLAISTSKTVISIQHSAFSQKRFSTARNTMGTAKTLTTDFAIPLRPLRPEFTLRGSEWAVNPFCSLAEC
jgi:hypothetical protein